MTHLMSFENFHFWNDAYSLSRDCNFGHGSGWLGDYSTGLPCYEVVDLRFGYYNRVEEAHHLFRRHQLLLTSWMYRYFALKVFINCLRKPLCISSATSYWIYSYLNYGQICKMVMVIQWLWRVAHLSDSLGYKLIHTVCNIPYTYPIYSPIHTLYGM